jgi:GNAT superfamily N-acetyltransferase
MLNCRPVGPDNWVDAETLFHRHGVLNGCWCQWYRLTRADFNGFDRHAKRDLLHDAMIRGHAIGILAYDGDQPVGWVAVSPREDQPGLDRSPRLKPVDAAPVWSVTCFYVERAYRGRGLTRTLLDAAADYAKSLGATLLEGYPVDAKGQRKDVGNVFPGLPSVFEKCGFKEVARRSSARPIMRRKL